MRALLPKTQLRKLEIIEYLYFKQDWSTIKQIANHFKYSERTIKNDLAEIKKSIKNLSIEHSNTGIRMTIIRNYGIETVYRQMFDQNAVFRLLEYLLFNGDTEIEDLSHDLFVSNSTLYRLIDYINDSFQNKLQIWIATGPVSLKGKESDIRFLMAQYYTESYSSFKWPFINLEEKMIQTLISFFIKYSKQQTTDAFCRALKLTTSVNLLRTMNGNHSDLIVSSKKSNKFYSFLLADSEFKTYRQIFKEKYQLELDKNCLEQLFGAYLKPLYFFNVEEYQQAKKKDAFVRLSYEYLTQLFSELTEKFGLTLKNKDQLVLQLHNSVQLENIETKATFLMSERKKHFCHLIKNEEPKFYNILKNGILEYRELMQRDTNEQKIYHMVYLVYINWENLLVYLNDHIPKIPTLVVSDFDQGHAYVLKDILSHHTNDLEITIGNSLDLTDLQDNDCQLIISNFYIPQIVNKHIFVVDSIPTDIDLKLLNQLIKEIKEK